MNTSKSKFFFSPIIATIFLSCNMLPLLTAADTFPATSQSLLHEGRKMEILQHESDPAWGYTKQQRDTFIVLHPAEAHRPKMPLYVVLHSAGDNVYSALLSPAKKESRDLFYSPPGFYSLYLDCFYNRDPDWWWWKANTDEISPVENRVMATVAWAIKKYDIDPERVYLCGISMGGSGTLGIGLRHGDVFAALKACVPAGIDHAARRLFLPPLEVPASLELPDPPICIDYSAQNDNWSKKHEVFFAGMEARKYSLIAYWGPFGHSCNHGEIKKSNDLIESFDWTEIRRNQAYPAFTAASSDDRDPWRNTESFAEKGQINAFFRWQNKSDTPKQFEMDIFLVTSQTLETSFPIPAQATTAITLRRLQQFKIAADEKVRWSFGAASGIAQADSTGHITIPDLTILPTPQTLSLSHTTSE